MRRSLLFILSLFVAALAGCRQSMELKASERQTQSTETDVEAHRLDSLCRLFIERLKVHVEFFNPNEVLPLQDNLPENPFAGSPLQSTKATQQGAAPRSTVTANSQFTPQGVCTGVGGIGAVKSIDIEAESTMQELSLSATDTTAVFKTDTETDRQREKASEIRHDNGTVTIVSVVGALLLLAALVIVINKVLKR